MARESVTTVVKRRLLGVLFLFLVCSLIALSVAIYNKVFVRTVDVTLEADHTGNQLLVDSDVKERGIIVGSVKSVTASGTGAIVKLALNPSRVDDIPANVRAQILPKTLFGEQYVALICPKTPAPGHIEANATIPQDRSQGALETERVLGDVLPLLTAVQPAELNATLTALAEALHDRGAALGRSLVNLDRYLKEINPHGTRLVDDMVKLGKVSLEYNDLAPDIFSTLKNLQVSAKTLIARQAGLDSLLVSGTDASKVIGGFLNANEQRIIQVTGQTTKVYTLLNTFSPEYGCLFSAVNKLYDLVNTSIYDHRIHLSVTVDANNLGAYRNNSKIDDTPVLVTGYGPSCFGLPDDPRPTDANGRFQIPDKFKCLRDGVNGGALTKEGEGPNCSAETSADGARALNSPEENALVNTLIAAQLDTTADKVPGVATLLGAPLLRGQKVTVK
jgi:virulence factor Mce-like protein